MSKARRVSKILDGELKTDAVGLKNPTREAPPAGLENQSDANIELARRVDELETPEGLPDHTHEYADKQHDHPKEDYEHDHDADYAQRKHTHDSDYAAEGHSHDSKYELLTHASTEHTRLDEKIDHHAGNEHKFLPLAGGTMDFGAKLEWSSNDGIIDGLAEAISPQSPVRKKEFDSALLGGNENLEKIEANTDAIEKEVQDRKDADALKADKDHTHDADTAPHTHDEYQPKGDYAAGDHAHDPQDLTHDHDGTYAPEAHRHDAVYAPIHPHPYAADDHDHDAEYVHEHPYAADDHTHEPQDLTHDHNDQYFAKGGESDDDGNPLPLPYPDGYTLGTALDEHGHEFPDPVYMGDEEPEKPEEGDLWYDTNRLEMFIRYDGGWITTTALGARVAEGEAKQREIEQELAFTRTRLAGVQGDSLAYGMWRLSLANQNPRAGDFVFLTSQMTVTHELGETKYMQINETDTQDKTVSFTGIEGGDVVRITEPGDSPVTLYIKKQISKGLFEVFVQEGTGRPRSNENHFVDFIRNDLRTAALRYDPIFRFFVKDSRTKRDGDVYYDNSGKFYVSFKTLYSRIWGTGGWDSGFHSVPPTYPDGIANTSGKSVGMSETVTIEDVASGVQLAYFTALGTSFYQFLELDGVTIKPYTTTMMHNISIDKTKSMRMTLPKAESLIRIRMGSWL